MDGIDITVIVYNPCVEGRELVSWLLYTTRVWREGVGIMVIVYNPCVKGREFGIMVIV